MVAVVAVVGLAAVIALGAALWLRDDGSGTAGTTTTSTTTSTPRPSTTASTTTTSTSTTTTTTAPAAVWEGAGAPSADHQTLLDSADTMFATADSCRPVDDGEADPLNVYPQGPDVASIECRYGEAATIVFSLFADDAGMAGFFADRLASRDLARGTGAIGPTPPWQLDYADDPERGTGAIFGMERVTAGSERSEIGFVRSGLRTYAYSFSVGTDFPTFYRWWSDVFGGPAPPA